MLHQYRSPHNVIVFIAFLILNNVMLRAQDSQDLVRLASVKVDSLQINEYNQFLMEEIEASIRLEAGVITLYAVASKESPKFVTLFETYADSMQYKAHLTTPHFQKYKQGTATMVKHLALMVAKPIIYVRKDALSNAPSQDLFLKLVEIEIKEKGIDDFLMLSKNTVLPGIRSEPGLLMMYAISLKTTPTRVYVLEVYANEDAYKRHLISSHFLEFKRKSKRIIKRLKMTNVTPILLGSKPQ
ncbi:putative quinol monooxygenase [Pseudochryseolinea flava]|uniref:ABM domain-containing protein n=1 Tax=Pseudochryseolinea flava TaxID=2059302 RepID=A0A364Y583_9BACT|nr:antibiotic biosynthesis monooxygenase [Pseudochryseolinea flava]RAW02158.1 hypothetical protein DQQ10_06325 [Pseudochryseolinea flava]